MRIIEVTDNESGQRLDRLLGKYLNLAGRGFIYKMLRKKNITLNGKKCAGSERLTAGDVVTLFLSDETVEKFSCLRAPSVKKARLDILYEDEHVLLINKPAGMLSQKAREGDESLAEHVTDYLLDAGALTREDLRTFRPGVCNRLDRNTSGLVAAGKTLAGLQAMARVLKDRSIHKFYYCLVRGKVERAQTMAGFLVKDEASNRVKVYETGGAGRMEIITGFEPVFYLPPRETGGEGYTFLKVALITGRSHQIRAHLAFAGHPLVGDVKYGSSPVNEEAKRRFGVSRPMLHSSQVEFPRLEGPLSDLSGRSFCAPLPGDFIKILGAERAARLGQEVRA